MKIKLRISFLSLMWPYLYTHRESNKSFIPDSLVQSQNLTLVNMTFLMIHKYLKFLNFIFTVIENYWDIRDASVEILIFLFLPFYPAVPGQGNRKHERQIAISPFTPPVPVPRPGKERRQKKTLVLLSLLQPRSQGLIPDSTTDHLQSHSIPATTSQGSHSLSPPHLPHHIEFFSTSTA